MNILSSILFAINLYYPVPIELPDMLTSYQEISKLQGVMTCLDQDNNDCLWNYSFFLEGDMPYKTVFYFNNEKKLIQISITYWGRIDPSMFGSILAQTPLFSYETSTYEEHLQVEYEDVPIMLNSQGGDYRTCEAKYSVNIVVLNLLYGDIYSTPKKGFISKSPELK